MNVSIKRINYNNNIMTKRIIYKHKNKFINTN